MVTLTPAAGKVRETSDRDIDRAIAAAKRYLWATQQGNGTWQQTHYERRHQLPGGFPTAAVNFALTEAGEDVQNNPKMKKAIDALVAMKLTNTRVVAMRAMALGRVVAAMKQKNNPYKRQLVDDLKYLLLGNRKTRFRGAWGDAGPAKVGDNMSSQFAMMAMWETTQAGLELKLGIFRMAERTWLQRQQDSGGWRLAGLESVEEPADVRMTAAGLTCLYICWDALSTGSGKYRHLEELNKGWAFLDKNFKPDFYKNSYSMYCIQQLGMLSGRKFIGGHDWYAIAAEKLAEPRPAGSAYGGTLWGPTVRAAFELIVLARGRIPLTFNKLNYGEGTSWNYHPRDIARFSEYMKRTLERPMRWQIVDIKDNVQTLLDAPILLIQGEEELPLSDEQWALLREYTLRGGTLLFVPVNHDRKFTESVKQRLASLYEPQRKEAGSHYQLTEMPEDNPIYSIHQQFGPRARTYKLWSVSDGTRDLALLSERDICKAWQRKADVTMRYDYRLGVNLFFYVTGQNTLSSRLRPVFTKLGEVKPRHTAKVGWLKHNGNWNTQPYALDYLSDKLTVENRVKLDITKGVPITPDAIDAKGYTLLWMTGSDEMTLSPDEIKTLKDYVNQGGTLVVNPVGGSREFNLAARKQLMKIFLDDEIEGEDVRVDSGLMTGKLGDFRGPILNDLAMTREMRTKSGGVTPKPMVLYKKGGRALAILAPWGVHDTLDGHTAYGAMSYMPDSARDIGANIVLYAMTSKQTAKKDKTK
jgi:hypothetical protein